MTLANIPENIHSEFVVDSEGKVYAKSVTAIARLAGVTRKALLNGDRGLLVNIRRSHNVPKSLESFTGQDFTNGANIPDVLVASIIEYYAFDSEALNDVAKMNYRAMATVGFRVWFQQALGWKKPEAKDISLLGRTETIKLLRDYADVLETKEKLETKHPGLKMLSADTPEVVGLSSSFTLRQWLTYKGYELDAQSCRNLGKLVINTKRSVSQLKYNGSNGDETKTYTYEDLDLLDTSWQSFIED